MRLIKSNIFYQTILKLNDVLLKSHKRKAVIIFFIVVFSGFLEVLGLAVILPIISVALDNSLIHSNQYLETLYNYFGFISDRSFIIALLVGLIVVFVVKSTISVMILYEQSKFSYAISTDVAKMQFIRYYNKDLQFFTSHNTNVLYQNIRSYSTWLSSFVLLPLIGFFSEFIVVALVIFGLAAYDSKLFFMIGFTLAPVFYIIYRSTKSKMQKLESSKAIFDLEANKSLHQTLQGYVDVKLFNKDIFFINRYVNYQDKLNNSQSKTTAIQSLPAKIIEIAAVFGVTVIILYSLFSKTENESLIALLSIYIVAAYRLMPSLNRMLVALISVKSYHYLFNVLNDVKIESEIVNDQEANSIKFNDSIEIKNIHFKYPDADHETLSAISLKINKGDRIGFIGQSGAGKTTLINILLRFLKEDYGQIILDETTKLSEKNINVWRDLIGYVKQNVFILDGDFYENIAFGVEKRDVDQDKLKRVIKSAKLEDVISKLPNGLNTNIGENGTKLSGGQRQRIAIARALYKDAQILIFDEATSALDNETEKEITEAIDSLSSENKTMLIIAHRISTLKNCDKIVKLEHGRIKKIYTYNELIMENN